MTPEQSAIAARLVEELRSEVRSLVVVCEQVTPDADPAKLAKLAGLLWRQAEVAKGAAQALQAWAGGGPDA